MNALNICPFVINFQARHLSITLSFQVLGDTGKILRYSRRFNTSHGQMSV